MIAKVSNLRDQIGMQGNRPIMVCRVCSAEYSANKGDYWDVKEEHIFTCCGQPMQIVTKHIVYRPVMA